MDLTALMVLIVCCAVFLVVSAGIASYYARSRNKWIWPEGPRTTRQFGKFTAHFIHDPGLKFAHSDGDIARRAALAAHALWEVVLHEDAKYVADEFLLHVVEDEKYNSMYETALNEHLTKIDAQSGSKFLLTIVCRYSTFAETPETGNLVIRELLNNIIQDNNLGQLYPAGLQDRALERFQKHIAAGSLMSDR